MAGLVAYKWNTILPSLVLLTDKLDSLSMVYEDNQIISMSPKAYRP